jgi:hypothetical protein
MYCKYIIYIQYACDLYFDMYSQEDIVVVFQNQKPIQVLQLLVLLHMY